MKADNTRHLAKASRSRAEQTRRRAVTTLRQLASAGQPLTISVLAQQAGVSRSWLYTQPDLLAQIREEQPRPTTAVPSRQAASDGSLRPVPRWSRRTRSRSWASGSYSCSNARGTNSSAPCPGPPDR